MGVSVVLLGAATLGWGAPALKQSIKNSKFFRVDVGHKKVVGTGDYIAPALRLDLASLSTDQPQYWPNEKVYVKVMALLRGGQTLEGTWQKRDAATHPLTVKLNADGVAVVEIMDGAKQKLELGEYRVDLKSSDKKSSLSTTFAVVDGALGAISFAHEWKRVTTIDALEASPGGWFLGNPGGAGKRWGNGLSFKNELRVANKPYSGEAQVNSRCMLPGCNGTFAGRSLTLQVTDGKIEGTLQVGGHSGPFQIEVVTPQGSLRHQFEGSSHVERDMMLVSGGVGWTHRVGLAPYENTQPVAGRQLYVESKRESGSDAPFELESIVAQKGAVNLSIKIATAKAQVVAWSPKPDGSYAARVLHDKGDLKAGASVKVPVVGPYTLVTAGGFVDGKFKEGWALLFAPSQLEVALTAPPSGAPNRPLTVDVQVKGAGGKVSGILEVYDNRVASRSSFSGLASSIGDSVRATSRAVASWEDTTGIPDEEEAPPTRNGHSREKSKKDSADGMIGLGSIGTKGSGSGMGYGSGAGGLGARSAIGPSAAPPPPPAPMMKMAAPAKAVAGGGGSAAAGGANEDDVPKDIIREGEKKVVACQLVETDANGRASVTVTLPPQTGRVIARFVAVKGLDHAEGQRAVDVKLGAFADARLPRVLVPGAELKLRVDITNNFADAVNVLVKGTGLTQELREAVKPGSKTVELPLVARESGTLILQTSDGKGTPIDRRELPVALLDDQAVTYSRLEFGGAAQGVPVAADEEVVVYEGAGPLLQGVVMNVFTTTESWFGHAEALSAQVAVHAVLLAAIDKGLLADEGLKEQLRSTLNRSVRSLDEKFCPATGTDGLCRPYPGIAPSPLWSAWVGRNLHAARRALAQVGGNDQRVAEAATRVKAITARVDGALKAKRLSTAELGGYDQSGEAVIPVEIDGKVVYRVLTDDAVSKWAVDKLLPKIDWDAKTNELGFARAYDTFRFLKAFERTGALQYLTDVATALWLKGDRARFADVYRKITRGMILTQEPGLIQGPALLGGVYSTPMALVRFLELQLLVGKEQAKAGATAKLAGRVVPFGQRATGGGTLELPAGAIARVDKKGKVRWDAAPGPEAATTRLSSTQAKVGEELALEVTLSGDLDPMEHYAIVAVPSTVAIKQTEDILSDYRGQLLYGQQVTGGTRLQLLAIPFRGSRSMKLLLEGAYPGKSPGRVAIRHIEKADGLSVRRIADVVVE